MAKTVKKEDIDEKAIMATFLQDEPSDHESLIKSGKVEIEDEDEIPVTESPKEDPRRKRNRESDYESVFIRESSVTARTGKMVYIRKDFHDTIQWICKVIAESEVSLSGYIDNVLKHHFDTYEEEIKRLYGDKIKRVNIIKKIK
jgi:Protein of unknown function (DUF3408).